jgi:hypothetical protein
MSDTSYDTSYDTTYDTSYDTSYAATYEYSYDSTDWSTVAEVSEGYTDVYQWGTEAANTYYTASTEAWLEGDGMAAYELNQSYLAATAGADVAWDTANSVWTDMAETTSVYSYDVPADTNWSALPVDTSWSAAPVDTSWSAAPADTSWSAAPADTSAEGY